MSRYKYTIKAFDEDDNILAEAQLTASNDLEAFTWWCQLDRVQELHDEDIQRTVIKSKPIKEPK